MNKMRQAMLCGLLGGLGILLLSSSFASASAMGKVSDFSGDVFLTRGTEKIPAAIGLDIASGDVITIGNGTWIEVVSGGKCQVWELKEAGQFVFTEHEVMTQGGERVEPSGRLSVCYNPAGFSVGKAQRIGGIIERGGSVGDELAKIGSNAALINLIIIYGVNEGDIEKARPHFDTLKERAPDSEFVRNVAALFERK